MESHKAFENYLLKITLASDCREAEVIQPLWSGYGKIARYQLKDSVYSTVVVKHISLNQVHKHPRGWDTGNSHIRKVKSYKVESHWYEKWSDRCTENCKVPKLLGSYTQEQEQWIVLEDLDDEYAVRKDQVYLTEVKVCLEWLAHFHAIFMNQEPAGLWSVGTYWHLDTRPDELAKMNHPTLKAAAQRVDDLLNQCTYKTIVHGDAKLANFCFSTNGMRVAAVDFQYVGGGCGVKDVAYLLGSCMSGPECELYENELLNQYFDLLKNALTSSDIDADAVEEEWRMLYPVACTDFMRFLLGWMPTHHKINDYNLNMMNTVVANLTAQFE